MANSLLLSSRERDLTEFCSFEWCGKRNSDVPRHPTRMDGQTGFPHTPPPQQENTNRMQDPSSILSSVATYEFVFVYLHATFDCVNE